MSLRVLVQPFVTEAPGATQGLDIAITVWNYSLGFALLQESSCSWMGQYRIDAPGIRIQMGDCLSDFMAFRRLAPLGRMVHRRTSLDLDGPLPNPLTFRVGLVQPELKVTQDEVLRRSQRNIDNLYSPGNLPDRELYTGKQLIFWSDPVTVRARTRWFNVLQQSPRRRS